MIVMAILKTEKSMKNSVKYWNNQLLAKWKITAGKIRKTAKADNISFLKNLNQNKEEKQESHLKHQNNFWSVLMNSFRQLAKNWPARSMIGYRLCNGTCI